MTQFRPLLFGGVCSLALMSCFVASDIGRAASAVKNSGNDSAHLVRVADNASTPAWAAEATMNPEYAQGDTSPASPPSANDDAPPPPTGGQATTEYLGGTAAPQNPPWAAEATMNPDYQKGEAPAATTATATEEAPPPPTGGQATTEYLGGTAAPQNPPWAAEATMNPDYNTAVAPSAPPSEGATQPAVAEPRNASVEACREALNTAARVARLFFAAESFDIAPDTRGALKKIVAILKNCRNVTIEVEGYTDSTGTPTNNKRLSELRAKSVVDFLAAAGVDPSKLKAIGFGQERPITTNSTPEGRRMNRRIEFFISGQ